MSESKSDSKPTAAAAASSLPSSTSADHWSEVSNKLSALKSSSAFERNPSNAVRVAAVSELLALEKKCRLSGDVRSTAAICVCILQIHYEWRDMDALCEQLSILFKRRAQIQKAQESMTTFAVEALAKLSVDFPSNTLAVEKQLIECVRKVSEGRIFVELERARVTALLASRLEDEGKSSEAADLLNEIQVETIGSMAVLEKAQLLNEQFRLCLLKKDIVRAEIVAKKIDTKTFTEESIVKDEKKFLRAQELKVRFHQLQIAYFAQQKSFFDLAQAFREIYFTPIIQADANTKKAALLSWIIFAVLAPFDSEVNDVLQRLKAELDSAAGDELTSWKEVLCAYMSDEVMAWPINELEQWKKMFTSIQPFTQFILNNDQRPEKMTATLKTTLANHQSTSNSNDMDIERHNAAAALTSTAASAAVDLPAHCLRSLHRRVMEHNIRVLSLYYDRISTTRFAELLQLSNVESEEVLSAMVSSGQCFARVDRRAHIISFHRPPNSNELIRQWGDDLNSLNTLVERCCHLINKEFMTHKVK